MPCTGGMDYFTYSQSVVVKVPNSLSFCASSRRPRVVLDSKEDLSLPRAEADHEDFHTKMVFSP